jgi:hypothetical protein
VHRQAGPRDLLPRQHLGPLEDGPLVQRGQLSVLEHHAAVDQYRPDAGAGRRVDEVVDRVQERLPLGTSRS